MSEKEGEKDIILREIMDATCLSNGMYENRTTCSKLYRATMSDSIVPELDNTRDNPAMEDEELVEETLLYFADERTSSVCRPPS